MQIFYKFTTVVLDEQIVLLADLFGHYRPVDGFSVRHRIIMIHTVLYKPVRKVLYAVFPHQTPAQRFLPARTISDVKGYRDIVIEHITLIAHTHHFFAGKQFSLYLLFVVKVKLCIILQKVRVFRKHFAVCLLRAVFHDLVGNDFTAFAVRLGSLALFPKPHDMCVFFFFIRREVIVVFNKFCNTHGDFGPF